MGGKFPSGVAAVGVGDMDFGTLYQKRDLPGPRDPYELAAEAFKNALDDAGLKKEDIDGVLCVRDIKKYEYFCYKVGIEKPRLVNGLESSGRQSGIALQYAAMAIAAGMAHTVAVVYSNNGRTAAFNYGGDGDGGDPFGILHGMTSPGAQVAAMFNRYCHEFGATEQSLAKLAVSNRYHASLHSHSVMKKLFTEEEYLQTRYITEPLRLFDYCLINDGAVCIILTTVERAKDLRKPVVEMIATSACGDMASSYMKEDFFYKGLRMVSQDLCAAAGVKAGDMDCVQIYDNFTATMMFTMEGIGLCDRGGAGEYIDKVGITLGKSPCPINTSNHTSETYMQGFNHQAECIRQLRGECGERQIPDSKLAMYICSAPIISGHIFAKR
ncbi:MAG: thiolase family protein [Peptococcaceae bacterium]|jgi:acetyl-CoA acetyltransferase|nr:thiolase family protein [Peptococcaceae bacterium]